jgi:hypothetical protein
MVTQVSDVAHGPLVLMYILNLQTQDKKVAFCGELKEEDTIR